MAVDMKKATHPVASAINPALDDSHGASDRSECGEKGELCCDRGGVGAQTGEISHKDDRSDTAGKILNHDRNR
ncbi:MAG: hypothetical protein V6Z86_02235 [Hyphomicrobiales bacterium]